VPHGLQIVFLRLQRVLGGYGTSLEVAKSIKFWSLTQRRLILRKLRVGTRPIQSPDGLQISATAVEDMVGAVEAKID
jgi:hypothetical protein